MNKTFIALLIGTSISLGGCSVSVYEHKNTVQSDVSDNEVLKSETLENEISKKEYDINSIAEKKNAEVGEMGSTYALNPSGGIGVNKVIKAKNIKKNDSVINNAIVFECAASEQNITTFLKDYAFFEIITSANDSSGDIVSYTSSGKDENGEEWIYIILETPEDLTQYSYIMLGGLSDKNLSSKLIFDINDELREEFIIY